MNSIPTPNDVQAVRDNLKKADEAEADEALRAIFCEYAKNGRLNSTYIYSSEVRTIVMDQLLNAGWEENKHYSVNYCDGDDFIATRAYWTIDFSF